jgi:Cu+-exporting ATPase
MTSTPRRPSLNVIQSSAIDPVCGMTVDPARAAAKVEYDGRTFYFCSLHCARRFEPRPEYYLEGDHRREPMPSAKSEGVKYTCPMDPEIVQEGPGTCPKCGMALEPMAPTAEQGPDPEYVSMRSRFWVAMVLTIPVFTIAMAGLIPSESLMHWLHENMGVLNWVQLALATPVVLWCGWPFFERAWLSVVHRSPNMFTLISLGVGAAFLYSLVATVAPGVFPASFRSKHGAIEPYFDSAAVIITLVLLGQMLELRARAATGAAIRGLLGLAPKTARLVRRDGREFDVPIEQVIVGDTLRIRPGEKIPVDGVVIEGMSAVDESLVTGEAMPVPKEPGSKVIGGTINGTGALLMRAERVGGDTVLAQIVQLVSAAQRSRAPIEKVVNQVAQVFVPAVVAVAIAAFAGWVLFGTEPRVPHALLASVAVLIIACPCALGLATPMAILVGTGRGASAGVLFRDAEALETLRTIDTLVLDKTGTLTEGKPRLVTVEPIGGFNPDELLSLAAGLERASEHPLAAAIVQGAKERGLEPSNVLEFQSVTGQGVRGRLNGKRIVVGNATLLEGEYIELGEHLARVDQLRQEGQTVMMVAVDGQLAGLLGVTDPIKATTPEALRIVMLSGDSAATASAVGKRLGIEEVFADVLPDQKGAVIERLKAEGRKVAMAGDGINDAVALASADVGIAMGTGTDIAIHSAAVTLVKGDLRGIVRGIRLSRAISAGIRQNLFLAFIYNAVSVPLAAFGLVTPMIASAAMSLSSVSVILNSLRLSRVPLDDSSAGKTT